MRTSAIAGAMLLVGTLASACGGSTQPSCANKCLNAGVTQCSGIQVQTCTKGSDGCLDWSAAQPCPSGHFCDVAQRSCVACAGTCPSAGATQCAGTQVQTCTTDTRSCLAWGAATDCPGGAGTEFCDPAQQKCASCTNTCPLAGATQCSGAQIQTCTANTQGCLGWGVAVSCTSGKTCDPTQNMCVDICSVSDVQAACVQAANHFNSCCAGGFAPFTAAQLCQGFLARGDDPKVDCSNLASQACQAIHDGEQTAATPACCCPSQTFCDLSTSNWACVPSCKLPADCSGATPACVPDVGPQGVIESTAMICKTNQSQAWSGCNAGSGVCCPSGTDCVRDPAGNEYCTLACSAAQPCGGDPGTSCCTPIQGAQCDNCISSCAGSSYCMPCP